MPTKSVINHLLATPAVSGLVGTRIRPGKYDARDTQPALMVERTTKDPVTHSTGSTGTYFVFVSIWCVSTTYGTAEALADAVEEALAGFTKGADPKISMTQVLDIEYDPQGIILEKDEQREVFVVTCQLDVS